MTTMRFGTDCKISLQARDDAILSTFSSPEGDAVDDIQLALKESLQSPLDFPALDRMVLPDDSVAIALQPGLPCAAELVAGTVMAILETGVPAELITLVRSPEDPLPGAKILGSLDSKIAQRMTLVKHNSEDREQLSFLGASKQGDPIYVNRSLADAAVVLPIGVMTANENPHSCWYPTFSDSASIARASKARLKTIARPNEQHGEEHLAESKEVGWMLGVQFVIQLVPAGGDRAMHVLAGLPEAVWKQGTKLLNQSWSVEVEDQVGLVVAGIGGGLEQQTWDNVTRTISEMLPVVRSDGAIAICSQLKTKPSPAFRSLVNAEDFETADREIQRHASTDSLAAQRLNQALSQVRIYLLSDLEENVVEDLGVAHVADAKEIAKLATQFDSCMTLENAQHVSIMRKEHVDH